MTSNNAMQDILREKLSAYDFPYDTASLFADLSNQMQTELNLIISNYHIGEPLVYYSQTTEGWVLLTSNAILINECTKVHIVSFESFVSINSDPDERLAFDTTYKFELSNWVVKDKFDNAYLISIDKGKIYYSFYHVLIKILRTQGYLKGH